MKNWNYIEGAKVGNALVTGQVLAQRANKKFVYGGEVNGTHIVYRQPDGRAFTFSSENEIKQFIKDLDVYMGNKTGNETLHEYATSKPRVINDDKTGAEEFFKQLSDDVKEREKKDDADIEKVGNSLIGKTVWVKKSDGHQYKATVLREDGGRVYVNTGDGDQFWRLKHEIEVINKVGNIQYHKVGKISIRLEANDDDWTVYDADGNELKSGKGGLGRAKTWAEHFARFTNKKAGNSKWELPDGSTATVEDDGTIKIKKPRDSSIYITKLWDKERAEKQLTQKGAKKVGNSASDDKFAYVMREFDEGKLKTPDGKVVTDPAQAKAIAYSESKKTENGLARAFNALAKNKKVKNSAVREYKHSDGRVAQIDFNEDGSDADMSIYEDENSNKELEHKNFSTIRDAEQYVTSHGFRRI